MGEEVAACSRVALVNAGAEPHQLGDRRQAVVLRGHRERKPPVLRGAVCSSGMRRSWKGERCSLRSPSAHRARRNQTRNLRHVVPTARAVKLRASTGAFAALTQREELHSLQCLRKDRPHSAAPADGPTCLPRSLAAMISAF
jgi:hypothetical protein